jgi:ethanolamine ammonia-lyase small subunit
MIDKSETKQSSAESEIGNEKDFAAMKRATPARLDVGRAGNRYTTAAMLALRADHARAVDAVMTEVSRDWPRQYRLVEIQSEANDRSEYLRLPEKGRRIAKADIARLKKMYPSKLNASNRRSVLVCVGDGLSSAAVERNAGPLLGALSRKLVTTYRMLKPIFIRNARVRIEDHLGDVLGPDLICMIVGERPGLATAESLSAYVIYRPTLKSIEPDRTVISNIHRGGIPIAQAAGKIATLVDDAFRFGASGAALSAQMAPAESP